MKRCVIPALLLVFLMLTESSAEASVRRRVARAEANAQIRTLRLNYPGPWGLRWRNYADTRVFSDNGLLDQVLKRLLDEIADSGSSVDMMTARATPTPNPELQATLQRSRDILKTLKIEEPASVPQSDVPSSQTGKNSRFDVEIP